MSERAISLQHISKKYGDFLALKDLSLQVSYGEVFGFVGPNGAGKTTTIRILTGLAFPTSGKLEIIGLQYDPDALRIKQAMGYLPDRPYLYEKLTGREYLEFIHGVFSQNGKPNKIGHYLDLFDLNEWSDELVESYSHGMKQRLAFAGALLHDPRILVIDEPMVGLDPKGVRLIKDLFRQLASRNISIFLSTHNLEMAEEICNNIGIVHEGQLVACDNIEGLRSQASLPGSGLEEIFLRLTTEEVK